MVYAQAMAVPAAKMQYVTGLYGKAPVTPVVSRFSRTDAILPGRKGPALSLIYNNSDMCFCMCIRNVMLPEQEQAENQRQQQW